MLPIQELYPLLSTPRTVVITMHQKPDADAMGSALGLYHFLKQLGHKVTVISPTNWARWLNWMPGCDTVVDFELNREKADGIMDQAEWFFCLDFNVLLRTKNMAAKIRSLSCTRILIDHHQQPEVASFAYGVSDTAKSSTCEMVYDFITGSGHGDKINIDIAECLYAGVMGRYRIIPFPCRQCRRSRDGI